MTQHCTIVALFGATNSGKSTLFNRLVGHRLAIISAREQTTRQPMRGIALHSNVQLVFIDTPGIFDPRDDFDRAMVRSARRLIHDQPDYAILCVDASRPDQSNEEITRLLQKARERDQIGRIILLLNKSDRVKKPTLLSLAQSLGGEKFDRTFMVSARSGSGVEDVTDDVVKHAPAGPWLYPEDQLSDLPERLIAAEITREKVFTLFNQEVPYRTFVHSTSFEQKKDLRIGQDIIVNDRRYKPILIGKGGQALRRLGTEARLALCSFFDCKVHLFLNVRVEDWRASKSLREEFGL